MSHDPVFEFSEHFDGEYLRNLYSSIDEILIVFETYCDSVPLCINAIRNSMEVSDWRNAAMDIHRLKSAILIVRRTHLSEELHKIGQRINKAIFLSLPDDEISFSAEANDIIASFHRIQLEILAHLPLVYAEIDRMRIYFSHPQRCR